MLMLWVADAYDKEFGPGAIPAEFLVPCSPPRYNFEPKQVKSRSAPTMFLVWDGSRHFHRPPVPAALFFTVPASELMAGPHMINFP